MNFLPPQLDRLQSCIDKDADARRDGGGEAALVGGGHAVDDGTRLVQASNGTDDRTVVGRGRMSGQFTCARPVVESPVDAPQIAGGNQTLKGLVDGGAIAEVGKVARNPDLVRVGRHPGEEAGAQTGILRQDCHVRNMTHISDTGSVVRNLMQSSDKAESAFNVGIWSNATFRRGTRA